MAHRPSFRGIEIIDNKNNETLVLYIITNNNNYYYYIEENVFSCTVSDVEVSFTGTAANHCCSFT